MDLKRDSRIEPELHEHQQVLVQRRQRPRSAATDRPDAQRRDDGVPARLLIRHAHVVTVGEIERFVRDPRQLDGLPFGRFTRHALHFAEDEERFPNADSLRVSKQRLDCEHVGRVAHVDRNRDALLAGHRHSAATELRGIFDVVVDEEGVVEELQGRRREQGLFRATARRAARGEADGRTQPFAFPERIVRQEIVERSVARATTLGKQAFELTKDGLACFGERPFDQSDVVRHRSPSAPRFSRPARRLLPGSISEARKGPRIGAGPFLRLENPRADDPQKLLPSRAEAIVGDGLARNHASDLRKGDRIRRQAIDRKEGETRIEPRPLERRGMATAQLLHLLNEGFAPLALAAHRLVSRACRFPAQKSNPVDVPEALGKVVHQQLAGIERCRIDAQRLLLDLPMKDLFEELLFTREVMIEELLLHTSAPRDCLDACPAEALCGELLLCCSHDALTRSRGVPNLSQRATILSYRPIESASLLRETRPVLGAAPRARPTRSAFGATPRRRRQPAPRSKQPPSRLPYRPLRRRRNSWPSRGRMLEPRASPTCSVLPRATRRRRSAATSDTASDSSLPRVTTSRSSPDRACVARPATRRNRSRRRNAPR